MATMTAVPELPVELGAIEADAYRRMDVPAPAVPPWKIIRHLMSFRNERRLHRRRCDSTGAPILSAYPEGTPFPVYRNDVWWSDSWNPLNYGRDFDFSRPFFEQFAELQRQVPREGTSVFNCENCDYNSHTRFAKNCYMNSLIYGCEDTHYSYWMVDDKDVLDCFLVLKATLAYECVDCEKLYDCVGLQECSNCSSCHFSYQLRGCENCIGCSDLVRKQYHVLNRPVSPEEFLRVKGEILNGTADGWQRGLRMAEQAYTSAKQRAVHNMNCENCLGDHLLGCRNCLMCFDAINCEDCRWSISLGDSRDVYYSHSAGWPGCELIYQSAVSRGSNNIAFCYYTYMSHDLRYCDSSMSTSDCFGCIGLKRRQYCILNKQYSREDYFALRARVIAHMKETGEWGSFFPASLSTFPYNDSAAHDYFPLSEQEALAGGWRWRAEESRQVSAGAEAPPASLKQATDEILKTALICSNTGKPYKLIKQELDFYRQMNLPIPRLCPEARHVARAGRRNPYQLFERRCAATGAKLYTTLPPERGDKVYSEEAYAAAVA